MYNEVNFFGPGESSKSKKYDHNTLVLYHSWAIFSPIYQNIWSNSSFLLILFYTWNAPQEAAAIKWWKIAKNGKNSSHDVDISIKITVFYT